MRDFHFVLLVVSLQVIAFVIFNFVFEFPITKGRKEIQHNTLNDFEEKVADNHVGKTIITRNG